MSLGVISAMPNGVSTAVPATGASGANGLPGEFAALLSGELKGVLGLLADTGKRQAGLEADQASSDQGNSETILGLVDPALIASLTGNAQFQPDIASRGSAVFQPGSDKTEKSVAGNLLAATDDQTGAAFVELDTARGSAKAAAAVEKINLAGNNSVNGNSLSNSGAANIAVEAPPLEASASALPNNMSAVAAGRPLPETQSNQPQVNTHLRDASWPQQFGEKIVWLAKNDQQTAQININPPQLGPVQITLNLSGDHATLAFASPHLEVRQAIESALPQLKELLSSAGINLGQANVGANLAQQNPDNPSQSANENRLANENAILRANDNAASTGAGTVLQRGRGLVDLFA